MLIIKKLSKYYRIGKKDRFKALHNINLSFNEGELVSILGESGSGKSTLMNIIGGLDSNFEGDLIVDDQNIKDFTVKQLDQYRKNRVGFIFQSFNLIPHLSVIDNVAIAATLSNVSRKEKIKKAKQILKQVGLEKHINKKPNQLSGGQKQRVAIARALMNDPDIILADEPTGALDSKTSDQILKIIENIAKQGKLIIMVTHSQKVASISNRVITISDGEIIEDNKTKEIVVDKKNDDTTVYKQNLPFISAVKLAFNNMRQKLGRNILVSLGASIGITSVILMLSIGTGVENYVINQMKSTVNPLVVEVNQKTKNDNQQGPPVGLMDPKKGFTNEEIDKLSNIENVSKVTYGFSDFNVANSIKYNNETKPLTYFMTTSENTLKSNLINGKLPKVDEILINQKILNDFKLDKSAIGTKVDVELIINKVKITRTLVISGIYDSSSTGFNNIAQALFKYETLQKYYDKANQKLVPNSIYLVTKKSENTDDIKTKIAKMGYEGSALETLINTFTSMLDVITWVLSAIAAISLFVSAIMILVVLYISVVERTREIGVLKAIGARRKDIKRIFVSESFLIGFSGGVFGVGLAVILSMIINAVTNQMFKIEAVVVSYNYMFFGMIVSIGVSMIAGLLPAAKAAKLDPIESLRHE